MKLGAIEAGGTKFVVAIGNENGEVLERDSFPTTTPEETMNNIFKFFDGKNVEAIGLGCFGPIDPDLKSETYGYITTTPKPGWGHYNIVGALQEHYPQMPIGFDTDVNGAALGEAYFGAAKGLDSALYLTIGTGIGGGAIVEGNLVHGLLHPEMGHMYLERREDDTYKGKCPYHGTCFEGLAAGPAVEERWGVKGKDLPVDHPAWDLEAWYIAQALAIYVLTISPKKIILGGGIMHQSQLFPIIHKYLQERLNGYIQKDEITTDAIKDYIVWPELGDNAGVCGALALAKLALER
ncbi:MAG: ROK family protein [Erysipelotrichales bacterium]|nr:ROK family protein [Erysipelotrichales bacterium]